MGVKTWVSVGDSLAEGWYESAQGSAAGGQAGETLAQHRRLF